MRHLLLALALVILATPLHAGEPGRYEAIALHEGGAVGQSGTLKPKVLIIDTADGHLWTWSEHQLLTASDEGRAYGSALIYQGQLRPGRKMGEVVQQGGN
jgi:hypothetical protein